MQELLEAIKGALGQIFGEAASKVSIPVLVVLGLVILAPIFRLLKFLSSRGRPASFSPGMLGAMTAGPQPFSGLPPDSEQFLSALNQVDRGVSLFYEYFLYLVIILANVLAVYLYNAFQKDSSRDFLMTYFGVGYVIVMLFLVGQVFAARRRRRQASFPPSYGFFGAPSAGPGMGPIITRSFQSGPPEVHPLDNQALDRARALLEGGLNIAEVCAQIAPEYVMWDRGRQQFFCQSIQTALSLRRPT